MDCKNKIQVKGGHLFIDGVEIQCVTELNINWFCGEVSVDLSFETTSDLTEADTFDDMDDGKAADAE